MLTNIGIIFEVFPVNGILLTIDCYSVLAVILLKYFTKFHLKVYFCLINLSNSKRSSLNL